jgi:hypothetical protein
MKAVHATPKHIYASLEAHVVNSVVNNIFNVQGFFWKFGRVECKGEPAAARIELYETKVMCGLAARS